MRHNHSLVRLGDSIFALGGVHVNGSQMSAVEKFNSTDNTWSRHPEVLLSNLTEGLAVTRFPVSALDCTDCKCGRVSRTERIFGGKMEKVCIRVFLILSLSRYTPFLGLLPSWKREIWNATETISHPTSTVSVVPPW